MMIDKETPSWAEGCIKKYSFDAIRVMLDIIEAGLKKGEASANDVSPASRENFEEPKVIGAIMKASMRAMGFSQRTIKLTGRTYFLMVKNITKSTHGRMINVWQLTNPSNALEVKNWLESMLPIGKKTEIEQGELF